MPDAAPGLKEAIAEALDQSKYPTDEVQDDDGWDSFSEAEPAAPAAAPTSPAEAATGESQPAQPTPGDASETSESSATEVPETYWGVDLTGIPAERRAEVIAHFEQQDSTIQKLQARLSQAVQPGPPDNTPPAQPEELTDEALVKALGLDPETMDPSALTPIVTLARSVVELEDRLEGMSTREQAREAETQWNAAMDELETSYGKLPGTRLEQLQYAIDEQVSSPYELYFRLTAPIRQEVSTAAAEARRAALKREQSAGVPPTSRGAEPAPFEKGISLRDAVAKAAKQAETETKLKWRDAVKRRITGVPEAE